MKHPTILRLLLLVLITNPLLARGSRVTVTLTNDQTVKGELLSVRENSLVIATKMYSEYRVNLKDTSRIQVLKFRDIKSVEAPGTSYTLWGAGAGLIAGSAIGAAIARQNDPVIGTSTDWVIETYNPVGTASLILTGTILGAGIGGVISDAYSQNDLLLIPSESEDFAQLKEYSRYPEEEPEALQIVQYFTVVN